MITPLHSRPPRLILGSVVLWLGLGLSSLDASVLEVSTLFTGTPRFDAFVQLPNGDFLVAEGYSGSRVMRITPEGEVSTVVDQQAGPVFILPLSEKTFLVSNFQDGSIVEFDLEGAHRTLTKGLDAPVGLVRSSSGDLLVVNFGADYRGDSVSRIDSKGKVSLFAEDSRLNAPIDLCFGPGGRLYVASFNDGKIFTVTRERVEFFARLPSGRINHMTCGESSLFTTSALSNKVYRVSADGTVAELAGRGFRASEDGPADEASFFKPNGIVLGADEILVGEPTGSIRRITLPEKIEVMESREGAAPDAGLGTFSANVDP